MCKSVRSSTMSNGLNSSVSILIIVTLSLLNGLTNATEEFLSASSVDEGPCISDHHGYQQFDGHFLMENKWWYAPYGSKKFYRHYFESMRGRPAKDMDELKSMQVVMGWWPTHPHLRSIGFAGSNDIPENAKFMDQPDGDHLNVTVQDIDDAVLLWTDNNQIMAYIRCINENEKDIKVLSTTRTISPDAVKIINERAREFGYDDKKDFEYATYNNGYEPPPYFED